MTQISSNPIEILMVEDNPGDVRLAREAMKEAKVWNEIHDVQDGEEAVAFMKREGKYENAPVPDLIFLDLNLPKMDGRQFLTWLRASPEFTHVPVVVLTTSQAEEDVLKSYGLHANCYVVKPIDLDRFVEVVQSIEGFWLSMVKLPPKARKSA